MLSITFRIGKDGPSPRKKTLARKYPLGADPLGTRIKHIAYEFAYFNMRAVG
jgi:hypothetical protein